MEQYFNVQLEFDHDAIKKKIADSIASRQKGYICIVDANVLTMAQQNEQYCMVLNSSIVNSCDGSSIAMLAGFIHKKKFRAWNGPDIFSYYIEKKYKQLLLGSNDETLSSIKGILTSKGLENTHISALSLPYLPVEEFDYTEIARLINEINPDIIWVSLGAPKQELFMNKLLPLINNSLMFGIGAAFNFYIGKIALPNMKIGALKFIWISRIFSEPRKQLSRILPYVKMLPKLYFNEKRKVLAKTR